MHPLLQALFGAWEWRPVVGIISAAAGLDLRDGLVAAASQARAESRLASVPRLMTYLVGMFVLAAALMSPVDRLGPQLFLMHMIQHLLSIMVAAPLLCLAEPFPIGLWGLPQPLRRRVARLFMNDSVMRQALRLVTQPAIMWLAFIFILLGWHDAARTTRRCATSGCTTSSTSPFL